MAVVSYVADCAHGAVTLAACCCLLTQWRWRKCMRMYYVIRIYINKYSLSFLRAIGSITLDYTHALPSFLTLRACSFHFILPIATSLRFDAIQNLISNLFPDCVAVSNDLLWLLCRCWLNILVSKCRYNDDIDDDDGKTKYPRRIQFIQFITKHCCMQISSRGKWSTCSQRAYTLYRCTYMRIADTHTMHAAHREIFIARQCHRECNLHTQTYAAHTPTAATASH